MATTVCVDESNEGITDIDLYGKAALNTSTVHCNGHISNEVLVEVVADGTPDDIAVTVPTLKSEGTTVPDASDKDGNSVDVTKNDKTEEADSNAGTENADQDAKPAKKARPRVLKVEQDGIFTIKTLEGTNFFLEWYRGLCASTPYIVRLMKLFWSLSPTRVSILVTANLLKSVVPSFQIWVTKQFLDQVHLAAAGKAWRVKRLILLAFLGVGARVCNQGLELIS
jgi:hypothetical protein